MTSTNDMQAVVLADRNGAELGVLANELPVCLLPVAGKPLLQFSLELLARAGIRDVLLVVSAHADRVASFVGRGERWGLRIRTLLSQGNLAAGEVLRRDTSLGDGPLLMLRGDVLRDVDPTAIAGEVAAPTRLSGAGSDLAITLVPDPTMVDDAGLASLDWPPSDCPTATRDVAGARFFPVDGVRAYHDANMALVSGTVRHVMPDGREVDGIWTGIGARYSRGSVHGTPVYIGRNSDVNADAELLDGVVLNGDVVVDRNATIRNTVVLPHSYIGDMVNVENAVVSGNTMIDIDSGHVLSVVDRFLLADMRRATLSASVADALNRLLGTALLLLSIPLWPLAALATVGRSRRPVTLRGNRRDDGSRGEFTVRVFATGVPVLRSLPLLGPVAAGHLRLVGVSPLSPAEDDGREAEWERVRDDAPVGLLGPTQIQLGPDAPLEERLMSDAWYARHRGTAADAGWLLKSLGALFTSRAWSTRSSRSPV